MKRWLLVTLLWCISPAQAHDFWIQPDNFHSATSLTLQVGHGAARQRSPIAPRRITRFEAIAADGSASDLHDLSFRAPAAGLYVLALETDNRAQTRLPALRFNDYLQAEGLTQALAERQRTQRMQAEGSERYSRVAKSILQVGPTGDASRVTAPLGLRLEIVPEENPYAASRGATLPVRVFYEGQPLAGALVKLTDLRHDEEPVDMQRTDPDGRARFAVPQQGSWLLNVIWTKALPAPNDVDFETVFSSLSFGYEAER